jgi:hypothetical protein
MTQSQEDNVKIKRVIESNQPFFIGRIAGIELKVAYEVENYIRSSILIQDRFELENNAGIHVTSEESLRDYAKQLLSSYDHCTMIAEWETTGKVFTLTGTGQQFISTRTPTIPKIDALALEPYYYQDSWMNSVTGKRILIIHPFVQTIEKQIKQLPLLFPGRSWFSNCTFECVSPPVTLAGNHQGMDWREHYREFKEKLAAIGEFDIALVAAGGYGMLVSDFIFTHMKKSVIYVGGALQLFFGIIGKRWFDNKRIMELVNDDWVRPLSSEKPSNCIRVEKGCYW